MTAPPTTSDIQTVACIGGGVIGAGWAARFALAGLKVRVYDPDPAARAAVARVLQNARRARRDLFPGADESFGEVQCVDNLADACSAADFAQESAPEREDLKVALLRDADRCLPARAALASSTSGLRPSRLQAEMKNPARLCVGHPFNPVYLLPLVEVCGGQQTAPATLDAAENFYRRCGMRPLRIRREIDGFIADRLMEALWREALWLAHDDIADAEDIDDAVRYGCGIRWAFMGTFLTFRLAGGKDGMRHFLQQFGPALKLPWTKLMDTPELTDELLEKLTAQSDAQAAGRNHDELERLRDRCIVAVMNALRGPNFAVGEFLNRLPAPAPPPPPPEQWRRPLHLHHTWIPAEWMDYNGHMNESRYLQVAGDASDAVLALLGAGAAYAAAGRSFYTAETHLRHLAEAFVGQRLRVETQVVDGDAKRLHLFHTLQRKGGGEGGGKAEESGEAGESGEAEEAGKAGKAEESITTKERRERKAEGDEWRPVATAEHMLLHVDRRTGKVAPARGEVAENIRKLLAAQSALPRPPGLGGKVGRR